MIRNVNTFIGALITKPKQTGKLSKAQLCRFSYQPFPLTYKLFTNKPISLVNPACNDGHENRLRYPAPSRPSGNAAEVGRKRSR